MITTPLKLLIAALVSVLTLGGGVALTTAGSAGADDLARAGSCQAEKKDVKKAKKDLKQADSKEERKEARRDLKKAKKRLKDCQSSASPSPSSSGTPTSSPSASPTDGGGNCLPIVNLCEPQQDE